jgi:protein-S-isoprenylcysteine O-methyltransferase Ste14
MQRLITGLELKLPPVLVAALCLAVMIGAAWLARAWRIQLPGRYLLAGAVAALGVGIALAGVRALRRARTTLSPFSPHKTAVLVVDGIYARSRNPMYLGLAILLAGVAIALANPLALVGPLLFVAWITRFQIVPEERVLGDRIGSVYADYVATTPRWLGRRRDRPGGSSPPPPGDFR